MKLPKLIWNNPKLIFLQWFTTPNCPKQIQTIFKSLPNSSYTFLIKILKGFYKNILRTIIFKASQWSRNSNQSHWAKQSYNTNKYALWAYLKIWNICHICLMGLLTKKIICLMGLLTKKIICLMGLLTKKIICLMGLLTKKIICLMGLLNKICLMGLLNKICLMGLLNKICLMGLLTNIKYFVVPWAYVCNWVI